MGKLKGSTLIETLVASIIVGIVLSVTVLIHTNLLFAQDSNRIDYMLKAEKIKKSLIKPDLQERVDIPENITVETKLTPYQDRDDVDHVTVIIKNGKKTVYTLNELIYRKNDEKIFQ